MKKKLLSLTLCLAVLAGTFGTAVSIAQAKTQPKHKTSVTNQKKKAVNRYELATPDITNPKAFEATFNNVKALVAKNNKAAVANYVKYPLTVYCPHNKKLVIKNKTDFIRNYSKIFTPKVKKALLNQKVQNTFVNHSGVCVNNGELWFGAIGKGKYGIISVNIF